VSQPPRTTRLTPALIGAQPCRGRQPMTGTDWTAAVAGCLAGQSRHQVPLAELGVLLRQIPRGKQRAVAARHVRAAVLQLQRAGLVIFAHHMPPVVGVLDRDGLQCIAGTAERG
jgi:hypothetical protein